MMGWTCNSYGHTERCMYDIGRKTGKEAIYSQVETKVEGNITQNLEELDWKES